MTDPKVGENVIYCIAEGQWRPAVVVQTWGGSAANLVVFLDGGNDNRYPNTGEDGALTVWKTSQMPGDLIGNWKRLND